VSLTTTNDFSSSVPSSLLLIFIRSNGKLTINWSVAVEIEPEKLDLQTGLSIEHWNLLRQHLVWIIIQMRHKHKAKVR
jgi:hypothetical protein